jgi:hypothetical protein
VQSTRRSFRGDHDGCFLPAGISGARSDAVIGFAGKFFLTNDADRVLAGNPGEGNAPVILPIFKHFTLNSGFFSRGTLHIEASLEVFDQKIKPEVITSGFVKILVWVISFSSWNFYPA